jgi:hypothetical protein
MGLNAGMYDENGELCHQMLGQRIGIFIHMDHHWIPLLSIL